MPKPTAPPTEPSKPAVNEPVAEVHPKDAPTVKTNTIPVPPAGKAATANVASNTSKPSAPAPAAPRPVEAKTESSKAIDPPTVAIADPKPASATSAPPKAAEPLANAADHSPVLKFDPLDFDPERLSASAKGASNSNASTSSIPDKPPVEPAGNEAASAVVVASQAKKPAASGLLPPPGANASVTVRRGPPSDVAPRAAGQLLATRVKSFQVADMPLARLVETISGLAGTGVTLDPVALELVGISPRTAVSVNVQDATLEKLLHDPLTEHRLDVAEQGSSVRVVLPKVDEQHAIDYDVKDLVAGADAAVIGQLIEHFVSPATWKSAGGAGTVQVNGATLHIEQSDAVRRQVVIFCERLRLARGLSVRSKYPAALLSVESPYQRLSTKLDEHTTFTFLPWTRLTEVVRGWQEMTGLTILADWGALADAELGPSSPVACSAVDRPWHESLDGVLEPLGLGWWAVDGETIQITSLAALEKIQRIEFYQVPAKLRASFASNQALVDSLQKELVEAGGKQGKPTQTHIEADGPSGRLVVLATPRAHRHLSQRLGGDAKP